MYHSPIDILTTDILHQIEKGTDEEIYKAVVSVGINVDKDELLRALKYDRQQYQKGYWDGITDGQPKWIPVAERLPEKAEKCLAVVKSLLKNGNPFIWLMWYGPKVGFHYNDPEWGDVKMNDRVTHWMPLPEPPKGE